MASTINFGIDLGTSNSLIAKFDRGNVEVYKNPDGFKETLPSVVGFRNDRILIGERARTYLDKDPKSVIGRFKRKMGTSETFKIKSLNTSKSPVELSAIILKELKGFVHTGEEVESAVITIPASFDTIQSNATKEAGLQAGFKNVVLLQEPIAASLAYANKEKNVDLKNSQWLVYDLGGGTFDVALVKIVEGELTVMDHEGDNYLGGTDFDALIVEKIVVPELERKGSFSDLLAEMKRESGKYNKLWHSLLIRAEGAKVELTTKTSAEIDLGMVPDLEDDDGKPIDAIINITRSEFETVIKDIVENTIDWIKQILTRNSLQARDLQFVLMVGGSTYIPYVRKRVEEVMGIPVNTGIDPTNAIAVGAAYFAGTKEVTAHSPTKKIRTESVLKIRASYQKTSQESEETFTAKVEGDISGLQYRIANEDGSYDSGLKKLATRIVEDLPLREGACNQFTLKIIDDQGNNVPIDFDTIEIAQGRYSVAGQMLPEDLCLVKDDQAANDTRLELLFTKNSVLPSKTKKTVEVAKTIVKGSHDAITIMVVEGPSDRHSSTNKPIAELVISGTQLTKDLIRGTDIDLRFEINESREVTAAAYLNGTSQEFSQIFTRLFRTVSSKVLATEILMLETKVQDEIGEAEDSGQREVAEYLRKVLGGVQDLIISASDLSDDDVTDKRYKLEDQKRKLAQKVFELTSGKRLNQARLDYQEAKQRAGEVVRESGNDRERHLFSELLAREQTFINSTSPDKIQLITDELEQLRYQILWRTPGYLKAMFAHLVEKRASMNDQIQATQLIENGNRAVDREDVEALRQITGRLWDLMPSSDQSSEDIRAFTGII